MKKLLLSSLCIITLDAHAGDFKNFLPTSETLQTSWNSFSDTQKYVATGAALAGVALYAWWDRPSKASTRAKEWATQIPNHGFSYDTADYKTIAQEHHACQKRMGELYQKNIKGELLKDWQEACEEELVKSNKIIDPIREKITHQKKFRYWLFGSYTVTVQPYYNYTTSEADSTSEASHCNFTPRLRIQNSFCMLPITQYRYKEYETAWKLKKIVGYPLKRG